MLLSTLLWSCPGSEKGRDSGALGVPGLELQLHLRQQDHAKAEEARPASCALRGTFSKLNQYLHLYGELKWCLFSCVLREEQKFPLPQFLICKLFIVVGYIISSDSLPFEHSFWNIHPKRMNFIGKVRKQLMWKCELLCPPLRYVEASLKPMWDIQFILHLATITV